MNIANTHLFEDQVPMIEVLTTDNGRHVLGYNIGGFYPGPKVLVAGHDPVASRVYERLVQLPTLGWMRGSLTLVCLNLMEREGLQAHFGTTIAEHPDELVFLPYHLDARHHAAAARQGYWTVLRACAQLGMIEGRGLTYQPPKDLQHEDA